MDKTPKDDFVSVIYSVYIDGEKNTITFLNENMCVSALPFLKQVIKSFQKDIFGSITKPSKMQKGASPIST